jgi:hypothetical protein
MESLTVRTLKVSKFNHRQRRTLAADKPSLFESHADTPRRGRGRSRDAGRPTRLLQQISNLLQLPENVIRLLMGDGRFVGGA